jgi:lactoylglutathione lyase
MNYAYTIVYVSDVPAALDFYNRAFGFAVRFLHESNGYGELETGGTALAFAAHEVAGENLPDGYEPLSEMPRPAGIEIGFTTSAVELAMESAVRNGATLIAAPKMKPWGQTVAYVRCPFGVLIELCTPMG